MWIKSKYDGQLVNLTQAFKIDFEPNYYDNNPFRIVAISNGNDDGGTDLAPAEATLYAGTEKQCKAYKAWLEGEMRLLLIRDTFIEVEDEEDEEDESEQESNDE